MRIPPIDLSSAIRILKGEGRDELVSIINSPGMQHFGSMTLMREWDNVLKVLENQLIPQLAKGGEISSLLPAVKALQKSVGALSLMASQILSFIPGPIGIICSIINAIACFSSGNIVGGLFELMGCIPGAKLGIKGGGKILTKVGNEVIAIIEKNPELVKVLKNWEKFTANIHIKSKELNYSKIKEQTDKIQKEIANIEKYTQKPSRQFDTGFDGLASSWGFVGNGGTSVGKTYLRGAKLQQRGVSNYGLGYGVNPQAILWPK